MQSQILLPQLLDVMTRKGYPVFTKGDYNLNIVGIRAAQPMPDLFDDLIAVAYKVDGQWQAHFWPATTDPGLHYLERPMNSGGTAILVEGHYPKVYALGLHLARIRALVQVAPMRIYRDNNRNSTFDFLPETIGSGVFGINLHPAWSMAEARSVGRWSAGCQVPQRLKDFEQLYKLCEISSKLYGNRFSYSLMNENDFRS